MVPLIINVCFCVTLIAGVLGANEKFTLRKGTANSSRQTTERAQPVKDENVELDPACPEADGFFPDPEQCDKYLECRGGQLLNEKLCADGLVFNAYNPDVEKCDLPFNIDCSKKPKRQEPIPSTHCPRQNGYFAHENAKICNQFYYCVDGKFNMITCPDGLVYNEKTGNCGWPDEAKKKGCNSQDVFSFRCPTVDISVAQTHPRYPDADDCQYFFVCVNGDTPRRSGCKMGQVFNEASGSCDWPRNVPECAEWYKGILTDEQLEELEHPKPKVREPLKDSQSKRQKASLKRITTTEKASPLPEEEEAAAEEQ